MTAVPRFTSVRSITHTSVVVTYFDCGAVFVLSPPQSPIFTSILAFTVLILFTLPFTFALSALI